MENPYASGISLRDDTKLAALNTSLPLDRFPGQLEDCSMLTFDNWMPWQIQFRALMRFWSPQLLDILLGQVSRPELQSPLPDGEGRQADLELRKKQAVEWDRRDNYLQSMITIKLSDDVLTSLMVYDPPTSAELWKRLRTISRLKSGYSYLQAVANLTSTKYVDGDDVRDHILKMEFFRNQIICFDDRKIPDELFACFLRLSMPQSWNTAFLALPDSHTSIDVVKCIVSEFDYRKHLQILRAQDHNARHAQKRNARAKASRSSQSQGGR